MTGGDIDVFSFKVIAFQGHRYIINNLIEIRTTRSNWIASEVSVN